MSSYNFRWSLLCFCFLKSFSFILTICLKLFSSSCCKEIKNATHCQKRYWHLNWKIMSFFFSVYFISCEFSLLWIVKSCSSNLVCVRLTKCTKVFLTFLRRIKCVLTRLILTFCLTYLIMQLIYTIKICCNLSSLIFVALS